MKIEQIEKDKIQVVFSKEDLDSNKINFHSFMSNSKITQNLFLSILEIAKEEIGFETLNYDIAIETLVLNNSNFILTISRIKHNENKTSKKLKISRKDIKSYNSFAFNSFNDFYDFYNKVKFSLEYNKTLFYFNNNFYCILDNNSINNN